MTVGELAIFGPALPGTVAKRHIARMEIAKRLREIGDRGEWKAVVVFDGRQTERGYEGGAEEGILVIYSKARETADAVVERLAARISEKGDRLRVASDDWMVLLAATTFGAEGMKIAELEEWWEFGGGAGCSGHMIDR